MKILKYHIYTIYICKGIRKYHICWQCNRCSFKKCFKYLAQEGLIAAKHSSTPHIRILYMSKDHIKFQMYLLLLMV